MDWWNIGFGVLLTVGTAVFVASEFSLVTIDPAVAADHGDDRRARSVRAGLKHLSTELSSAQVGITITTILLGHTAQPAVANVLERAIGHSRLTTGASGVIAVVGALVLINVFSMLFGELVPKNFALSAPWPTARTVVPLQRGFTKVFRPLVVLLNGSANALLRAFGVEPREELSGARSAQELAALVRRSAQEGTLESGTARLLTNSLEFDELTAVDVMTDRMRVRVVRETDTAADVVALARDTGHSRFPVIGESRDDIVGLVHVRKVVAVPRDRRATVPVTALMAPAPQVPETVGLRPLLVELRGFGLQMAVVVDEYGGTSGIVTLEDVVEELVGEVADEHDPRRAGALRTADGSWLVPGVLRPDELTERTGISVPENAVYETLGGLVMAELGRVPKVGDEVVVPGRDATGAHPVAITVVTMLGRRVSGLRLRVGDR